MSETFQMFVPPAAIADANASAAGLLEIPDTANKKGDPNKPGGEAYWTEQFEVVLTNMGVDKEDASQVLVSISNQVVPDTTSVNAGRRLRQWYRLFPAAYSDKNHKEYKGTKFRLGRLNELLKAVGFGEAVANPQEQVDYGPFFSGETAWVLNKRFYGLIKHSWYNGKARQEIGGFMAIEEGNS